MTDEIAGKLAEFDVLSKSMKQKKQEIKKAIFYAKHPQLRMAKDEVEASKVKVKDAVKEPAKELAVKEPAKELAVKEPAKELAVKEPAKEPAVKDAAEIFNRVLKEETEKPAAKEPTVKESAKEPTVKESAKEPTVKESAKEPTVKEEPTIKIPPPAPPQHLKYAPLMVPLGGKWF